MRRGHIALGVLLFISGWGANAWAQQTRFTTGFAPSTETFKRSLDRVPRFRASLPLKVDLSPYLPPVGDQGDVGSCLAWATTYYMRSYYAGQQRGKPLNKDEAFSPAYVFNLTRTPLGNCSGGTTFEAAQKVLRTRGAPTWRDFPYSDRSCASFPNPTTDSVAAAYRIDEFKTISEDLDDIKGRLAKGHVVAFGMDLPASFHKYKGGVYEELRQAPEANSGHAMLLVGYDDERQAFRLVNSWGTAWGEKGFMWLGYQTFQKLHFQGEQYVMSAKDWPAPKTQPPEPPVSPTPSLPPQPVAPVFEPKVVEGQVAHLAGNVECSRIQGRVSDRGEVSLLGFAGGKDELAALVKTVSALPGVVKVQNEVRVETWPKCEAYVHFDAALNYGKGLAANFVGGKAGFADGASMAVEVQSPSFPAYLYVSYLQASGDVVHLAWPRLGSKPTPPNSKLTFGGGKNGQPVYRIGEPFGEEMVIVVASATPLFSEDLPRMQDDRAYLSLFRTAFMKTARDKQGQNTVSAVALPLQTYPAK